MPSMPRQVWPSRYPRLTILFFFLPFVLLWGCWNDLRPALTALQDYYLGRYIKSEIAADLGMKNGGSLVYLVSASHRAWPALNGDVLAVPVGTLRKGAAPFQLTQAAFDVGAVGLQERPVKSVTPGQLTTASAFHRFLFEFVYNNTSLLRLYERPILALVFLWLLLIPTGVYFDWKLHRKARVGVKLRGPDLVNRRQFNRKVKGDGLAFLLSRPRFTGFLTRRKDRMIRLRKRHEAQSIEIIGDTGSGKTTLILQTLKQVEQRGDVAFIYDPERQYVSRFFNAERGDIVLNPIDTRFPNWHPGEEVEGSGLLERLAKSRPVAQSLYPYRGSGESFFVKHSQDIFGFLLAKTCPTARELQRMFEDPNLLDLVVKGTEHEHTMLGNSPGQRQGIIGTLNHAAHAFRLVPDRNDEPTWTIRQWAKKPKGWVFVTATPDTEDALRPLQSLWIDLAILNTLAQGERSKGPQIWFVLDELASLQYLPKLQEGITRSRKTGNPFVLGFHGRAQLDKLYKEDAETILSQPSTKFLLRTSEPNASGWMSKLLGEQEIERPKESRGADGKRSWTQEITKRETVLPSQIGTLGDLEGYLKYGNQVLKIRFPKMDIEPSFPDLLARDISGVEPPIPLEEIIQRDKEDRERKVLAERKAAHQEPEEDPEPESTPATPGPQLVKKKEPRTKKARKKQEVEPAVEQVQEEEMSTTGELI